jgi:hypothetical protein
VAKLNPAGSGLVYSTYLGGSARDTGLGIAVDSFGSAYVTGETVSPDFPTVNAFQPVLKGDCSVPCSDVFVAKFDPQGASLAYSTYLGGEGEERGARIAVDTSGAAYVTGFTSSMKFPTTQGVWQGFLAGSTDAFVAKFSPSGFLVYSTYLGGLDRDQGTGIAVDSAGNAYVTGFTGSTISFPTSNAVQRNWRGAFDAFLTKLNATSSSLIYSTYLGGTDLEFNPAVVVDIFGNAYVTGLTSSTDFPTVNPFQADNKGGTGDVFVTKISETEQPVCTLKCTATVPSSARPATIVSFNATATSSPCSGLITFQWNFGDGSAASSEQNPSHIYPSLGSYVWTMTAQTTGASPCIKTGTIVITNPSRRQP